MATTRADVIKHVALKMDEVSPDISISDLTIDGSDNNPLYALIDGLVDAGALELFSVAPYWRLPQQDFTGKALETVGSERIINDGGSTVPQRKMIRLKVPNDFLRVAEITHPSFQRPITEVVPEMSEMGKRQHNPFLMAKGARPVGVMSHGVWTGGTEQNPTTENCREIDCYSIPSSGALTNLVATYIPKPSMPAPSSATDIENTIIPAVLIPAMEWIIAARTFGARGDANHAAICQQNAQNLLV